MSLEVLILESVGSCVDTSGVTYPLNIDGTPDTDAGVHVDDCSPEWFDSMSDEDHAEFDRWWVNLHALNN